MPTSRPLCIAEPVAKLRRSVVPGLSKRAKRGHLTPVGGGDAPPLRGIRASRSGLGGRRAANNMIAVGQGTIRRRVLA